MTTKDHYHSNDAIKTKEQDIYIFLPYALNIQEAIWNTAEYVEPIIYGIYGKWGEGKTSFLNLIFKGLEIPKTVSKKKILKYKFNPWRYNSEDKLLTEFFDGLVKVIKHDYGLKDDSALITKLKKYTLSVLSGVKVETETGWNLGFKTTIKTSYSFKDSHSFLKENGINDNLDAQKEAIDTELENYQFRIVIFIDDLDRLNKKELYNIFRLVKLTASFNNLTFILFFDNEMVAKAIYNNYGDTIQDGYKYLEKLINVPLVLPKLDKSKILNQLIKRLEHIFSIFKIDINQDYKEGDHNFNTGTSRFLSELKRIEEYISNPRMMVRLLNTFSTNLIALNKKVNYSDLIWLELLKIKYLKAYEFIKNKPESFISDIIFIPRQPNEEAWPGLSEFLIIENYNENEKKEITTIINILFPREENGVNHLTANMSESYRVKRDASLSKMERRINHPEYFDVFFNYHTEGAFPNALLDDLLDFSKNHTRDHIESELLSLTKSSNEKKVRYELESRLYNTNIHDKLNFINLILNSLGILTPDNETDTIFSKTPKQNLIETTFREASQLQFENIETLIDNRLNELNAEEVLYARKGLYNGISDKKELLEKIDSIVIEKTKNEFVDKPFFVEVKGHISRSIMSIWKSKNPIEFDDYIKKHLKKSTLSEFIKSFPTLWSSSGGEQLGNLDENNYNFLNEVFDAKKVYDLAVKVFPKIKSDEIENEDINWNEEEDKEDIEFVKQFIYWYKKNEN